MSVYTLCIFDRSKLLESYHFYTFESLYLKLVQEQTNPTFNDATHIFAFKGKDTIAKISY